MKSHEKTEKTAQQLKKIKKIKQIGIPVAILLVIAAAIAIYVNSLTSLVEEADFSGDPTLDESDIFNPDDYAATPTPNLELPDIDKPGGTDPTLGPSELKLIATAHDQALEKIPMASDSMVYNILLIGTDNRGNEINGRSDAMMILSVNQRTGAIHIASLMRALYVKIPGRGYSMLNAAFSWGGARLLIETIELNFKVPIHDYILINFGGFRQAIDTMGGVSINLTHTEAEYLNAIFSPKVPEPTTQSTNETTTESTTPSTALSATQTAPTVDSEDSQDEAQEEQDEAAAATTSEETGQTTQSTTTGTTTATSTVESTTQTSTSESTTEASTEETTESKPEESTQSTTQDPAITTTSETTVTTEATTSGTTFTAGIQTLNGNQALAYARIRKIDSDFQRTGRQRTVIEAIIKKARNMNLGQLDRLARQILPLIKSSRSGNGILRLVADGYSWRNYSISQKMIPVSGSAKMIIVRRAQMYQYDVTKNVSALQDFLYR